MASEASTSQVTLLQFLESLMYQDMEFRNLPVISPLEPTPSSSHAPPLEINNQHRITPKIRIPLFFPYDNNYLQPSVVSLGPYYYGKAKLLPMEALRRLKVDKLMIPGISELRHTWISAIEKPHKEEMKSINMQAFSGTDVLQKKLVERKTLRFSALNASSDASNEANPQHVCHEVKASIKVPGMKSSLGSPPKYSIKVFADCKDNAAAQDKVADADSGSQSVFVSLNSTSLRDTPLHGSQSIKDLIKGTLNSISVLAEYVESDSDTNHSSGLNTGHDALARKPILDVDATTGGNIEQTLGEREGGDADEVDKKVASASSV
ncbi:hypothetical protein Ancab_030389 [Ancistrocladus abbreviatus]